MTMTKEVNEATGQLAELVQQVQAGNEVVLTQGHKPVARLVSASPRDTGRGTPLRVRSLRGHLVLTPILSQSELAEELFGQQ
jgi:prevent-host-death family protein